MQITYKLEKLETGGFMAYCISTRPIIVKGKTEEEATKKLLIAAKMYVAGHPKLKDNLQSRTIEMS